MKATNKKGFTLVEILIVVVILGILAAIVIPQFSEASSEARNSSIQSNLQMVRSQIQLYKLQHNEDLPGSATGVDFVTALTSETNSAGSTTVGSGETGYGPYIPSGHFPRNAQNNLATVTTVTTTGTPTVSIAIGWEWNSVDSEFVCPYDTVTVTW